MSSPGEGLIKGIETPIDEKAQITKEALKAGLKSDKGKLRYDLVPVEALEEVVKVFTFGSEKYDDRNWEKGLNYSRVYAALQRHANAFWKGENLDDESKCYHMASVAFCALALIQYSKFNTEFDDRPIRCHTQTEKND